LSHPIGNLGVTSALSDILTQIAALYSKTGKENKLKLATDSRNGIISEYGTLGTHEI